MDVVLHHGGRGTLSCALASGIAQVILSWGADRPENALRAEAAGVAKSLPRASWRAEAVADAMESVSTLQVRNRCREIARRLAETDAPAAASRVIEDALVRAAAGVPSIPRAGHCDGDGQDIPPDLSGDRRELLALLLRKEKK
jgi:UDP:flavonoid glycosyltransferase YjiC (YdhE family)